METLLFPQISQSTFNIIMSFQLLIHLSHLGFCFEQKRATEFKITYTIWLFSATEDHSKIFMNASTPPQSGTVLEQGVETPKLGQPQRVPIILLQKLADKRPLLIMVHRKSVRSFHMRSLPSEVPRG